MNRNWFSSWTPVGVAFVIFLALMTCVGLAPIVYTVLVLVFAGLR